MNTELIRAYVEKASGELFYDKFLNKEKEELVVYLSEQTGISLDELSKLSPIALVCVTDFIGKPTGLVLLQAFLESLEPNYPGKYEGSWFTERRFLSALPDCYEYSLRGLWQAALLRKKPVPEDTVLPFTPAAAVWLSQFKCSRQDKILRHKTN